VVIETKQSDAVPSNHERNIFKPFVQLAHAHTAMSCIHLVYVAAVVESGGQCTEYKVYKLAACFGTLVMLVENSEDGSHAQSQIGVATTRVWFFLVS